MTSDSFLLDENIPKSVKKFLEGKGLSVDYVPKGAKDREVTSLASIRFNINE